MKGQKDRLPILRQSLANGKGLVTDIREMILQARQGAAQTVNSVLVGLYWAIGNRIHRDILKEKRADYGKEIVSALGRQLSREFGMGYSEKNLWHMIRFAEVFNDEKILSALRRELTWTHFKQ